MSRTITGEARSAWVRSLWLLAIWGFLRHSESCPVGCYWSSLAWDNIWAGTACYCCPHPPNIHMHTHQHGSTLAFRLPKPMGMWDAAVGPLQDKMMRPASNNCMVGPRQQMEFKSIPPTSSTHTHIHRHTTTKLFLSVKGLWGHAPPSPTGLPLEHSDSYTCREVCSKEDWFRKRPTQALCRCVLVPRVCPQDVGSR